MSGSSWVERAASRIEAWPVGPVAALMVGGATAFFCWAMPSSFMEAWFPVSGTSSARAWFIASPALLIAGLTWAGFLWIDARAANSVVMDEEMTMKTG